MKKRIVKCFALFLSAALALTACGGGGAQEVRLTFATGGVAGTYYPLGGEMAAVVNNHTNLNITSVASGASADNVQQIGNGDAHMAIVQNDVMSYAFYGTGFWEDRPTITNMATLMSLYPETVQIVVAADSDINSIEDLAGNRVSTGAVGSGVEANALQILGVHGLSPDDMTVLHLGFGDSANAMRDRQLDAFFVTAATPNAAVLELAVSRDLRILSIAPDKIAALMNSYAFYTQVTVDSNDYTFLTEPVQTIAVQATLIASTDMDEQVAYDIVKTLIEKADEISHGRGAYILAENAVQSISVDFHPGAARYFREIGVLN
ncbi:MAG: TAXI family TRAP transporter solute-binding subunit [Defluviitaleaceae bacterium]|nr:TAXI family TRAP transporter solute-binding subunit [Defluviitaleaceae bacterium]